MICFAVCLNKRNDFIVLVRLFTVPYIFEAEIFYYYILFWGGNDMLIEEILSPW